MVEPAAISAPPHTDARSDTALLDAIKSGDEAALSALLERYAPTVHRFSLQMCRHPEDARDVLQDTLLAAARGVRDFRGGASLSTWLFTIARSFCIKHRRRARAEAEPDPLGEERVMEAASGVPLPDEALSDREVGEALEQAISALEPPYREVLLLRDVEGLTALCKREAQAGSVPPEVQEAVQKALRELRARAG